MIKVGILGGESLVAGELLRLLVLHPEVELITVFSPRLRGRALNSVHKGMIGDTDLRFSDDIDLEALDVVFVTAAEPLLPPTVSLPENLKVIYIQDGHVFCPAPPFSGREFIPGVSEMFRKPLVRGADASRIVPSPLSVAVIILFPLALHLLLNDSLAVTVRMPLHAPTETDADHMRSEIVDLMGKVQLSFNDMAAVRVDRSNLLKTLTVEAEFNCSVPEDEIERIYNEIYDDHNFSFTVRTDPVATEVAGTQKCLLYVSKPCEDRVRVKAIADSFMRGGAGDAVHAMNLLFGLHEKTGLSFPASMAFRDEEIDPDQL